VTLASDYNVSTSSTMPSCNGDNNGTATATGAGGTAPYTYEWDDPAEQVTSTATGLEADTYRVTVTDAAGCVAVETVVVSEPAPITITVDSMGDQGTQLGYISVSVAGGTGGFGYEWLYNGEFFSSDEDIDGLSVGTYTLLVTDQTGCIAEQEIVVSVVDTRQEEALSRSIKLAPNPSSGKVFVSFELETETAVSFQVFDLAGKAATPLVNLRDASATLELDLTGTPSGVYLLRAIIGESVVLKRLVIGD
jgi:hypothetical protein